jgi:hypothetical protein
MVATHALFVQALLPSETKGEAVYDAAPRVEAMYWLWDLRRCDLADQLRGNFGCQRQWERRTWRPLAYWLFDVCPVNSYLLWRCQQPE